MAEDKSIEKFWNTLAQRLVGKRIVSAQYMSDKEARNHGWSHLPLVITFDDGSVIYASQDDEGNDAGALVGFDAEGGDLAFPMLRMAR